MFISRTLTFAALVALLALPFTTAPAAAGHHSDPVLVVSGIQGASGSTIGPDGAIYVTEAQTGSVLRVNQRTGAVSTYATGLPLRVIGLGGAIDVAFIGRTAYVLVTLVSADVGGSDVSGIYRIDGRNRFTVIADLGQWSTENPPTTAFDIPSGLQFALDVYKGGFIVTDGHHNRVLKVSRSGAISELVQFGNIVPTGLDVRNATVVLAEAGPVPHSPAEGKVVKFGVNSAHVRDVASGFSLLVDVEYGPCGGLFALSQGDSPGVVPAGSPALPDSGELLRATRGGTFAVVAAELDLPTSVEFIGKSAFIVTANGEIWRVAATHGGRC
jgi:hypothetical protein